MTGKPRDEYFLGTGWGFPPAFDRDSRSVEMVSDEKDIEQSLQILLSTGIGERVMQPHYGCALRDFQFEPISSTFVGFVADLVRRAILLYEPRIVVERVSVTEPDEVGPVDGKVIIRVDYVVSTTNSRRNFVYDFYRREVDSYAHEVGPRVSQV